MVFFHEFVNIVKQYEEEHAFQSTPYKDPRVVEKENDVFDLLERNGLLPLELKREATHLTTKP